MRVTVASDMDRTVVWSKRAGGDVDGLASRTVKEVETHRGVPTSFVTPRAHDLLTELTATGRFVPVTTRTIEQYRRIRLPGPTPPLALCANGGRLLVDGVEDAAWTRRADALAADTSSGEPFASVWPWFAAACHDGSGALLDFISRVSPVEELFVYAVAHDSWPQAWVDEVGERVAQAGWTWSVQGRKVYAVPQGLSKGDGVAALRALVPERFAGPDGAGVLVTAGDSWLDASLLQVGDVAWTPRDSELHRAGFTLPQLRVTDATGFAAGEELVEEFGRLLL